VNELSSRLIQQDVREVSISQTDDVTDHGGCRDASSVVESHGEPRHRILVTFGEVVSEDGLELLLERGEFVLHRVRTRTIGSLGERFHGGDEVVAADVLGSISRYEKEQYQRQQISPPSNRHLEKRREERRKTKRRENSPRMSPLEPCTECSGVSDELDDSGLGRERKDLVGSDGERARSSLGIVSKECVDDFEELLHDGVLTHVVLVLVLGIGKETERTR